MGQQTSPSLFEEVLMPARDRETSTPLNNNKEWSHTFNRTPTKETITILYRNVHRYPDDPLNSLYLTQHSFNPDVLCLCEMPMNCTRSNVEKLYKDFRTCWNHAAVSLGHTSDNFFQHRYKPGGVAVIALGPMTSRVIHKGHDEFRRWAWISLALSNSNTLTIITLYRPCQSTPTAAGPSTYFMQLYRQHLAQGAPVSVNPRQQLIYDFDDILSTIGSHQIMVNIDANEVSTNRDGVSIFDFLESRGMVSAYNLVTRDVSNIPPTYMRGTQCIDYIYVTPDL